MSIIRAVSYGMLLLAMAVSFALLPVVRRRPLISRPYEKSGVNGGIGTCAKQILDAALATLWLV
jgi:hypothetical protein